MKVTPGDKKAIVERHILGQMLKTNTTVIYYHFRLNYHRNIYNIEFTLE
jgi:hypothetical protein